MGLSSKLDKRIEVWGKVEVLDEYLQTTYEDVKLKTIWAQIVPQTAKLQSQQAETILTDTTHKIIVRYAAGKDIKQDQWIILNGRRFDINFILNPYEANVSLEIFVSELQG